MKLKLMGIPIKGFKINKQSQLVVVILEDLMKAFFKWCFFIGFIVHFFGWWKIYELIKPYLVN